ncbi:MAG: hypothetical protein QF723_07860, partial [Phycisphaerales bacterium]|nr:hypothetical protein [Phycisphaerales bacterium]
NTSTLFIRNNLLVYLMTGRDPGAKAWEGSPGGWDATPLVSHLRGLDGRDEAKDIVTYLARFTLGTAPTDGRLEEWTALAKSRDRIDNETLVHLLSLMTACPEYQLC